MRYSSLIYVAAILVSHRVTAECCGTNGVDSCCSTGGGKCNIFCCNCEQGCVAKEICSDKCLDSCMKGCPPIPADPKAWNWLGQQCYVACNKSCKPTENLGISNITLGNSNNTLGISNNTLGTSNNTLGTSNKTLGISNNNMALHLARNVFKRGVVMSDEAMFQELDGEGVGHFSYDQFLQKQGWQDSKAARDHFDRHDMDGDGVIKIDEMRIGGSLDQL